MADYYVHGGVPAQGSAGSSAAIRSELDSISSSFAKMPALSGNAGKLVAVNGAGTALTTTDTPDINGGTIDGAAIGGGTISGSAINSTPVGATTPSTGAFTNLSASGTFQLSGDQVQLSEGGTGANLSDPNADRIMFWDDSAGAVTWLSAGSGLSITGTTMSASPAQIQPISATVGSNALTISASALILDFRSTTLGSGSVTTVSGTPSNLVISSGSTLGTVNGEQSRIVVLAINNAGTIELAAVNIAGGLQLDETNLISTTAEGGAGGADSANVIYSTTARSGVAYRVIGYIESTQTTAGTWATAPSTIQGAGGQAIAAMSSIGYGQTWQNVAASRAHGTTYYNTTGKPIAVAIRSTATGTASSIIFVVDGTDTSADSANNTYQGYMTLFGIVPPGSSYSVTATTATKNRWVELR